MRGKNQGYTSRSIYRKWGGVIFAPRLTHSGMLSSVKGQMGQKGSPSNTRGPGASEKELSSYILGFDNQTFKGEGNTFSSGAKNARLSKP
jgi:hypothetical protein